MVEVFLLMILLDHMEIIQNSNLILFITTEQMLKCLKIQKCKLTLTLIDLDWPWLTLFDILYHSEEWYADYSTDAINNMLVEAEGEFGNSVAEKKILYIQIDSAILSRLNDQIIRLIKRMRLNGMTYYDSLWLIMTHCVLLWLIMTHIIQE